MQNMVCTIREHERRLSSHSEPELETRRALNPSVNPPPEPAQHVYALASERRRTPEILLDKTKSHPPSHRKHVPRRLTAIHDE